MRDYLDRVEESYAESEKVWNIFEVSDSNSELYTKEELATNKTQTVVHNKILAREHYHLEESHQTLNGKYEIVKMIYIIK